MLCDKKLNLDHLHLKPTRDDCSINSNESFSSDTSSVMDFRLLTKGSENKYDACTLGKGKYSEDEREGICIQLFSALDCSGA
ncbi:hypothetical protein TNCV_2964651 [Trichonephila clavipes]|nr:hypothetical protein TNCV_2964651 [Trichonephila clavipes]